MSSGQGPFVRIFWGSSSSRGFSFFGAAGRADGRGSADGVGLGEGREGSPASARETGLELSDPGCTELWAEPPNHSSPQHSPSCCKRCWLVLWDSDFGHNPSTHPHCFCSPEFTVGGRAGALRGVLGGWGWARGLRHSAAAHPAATPAAQRQPPENLPEVPHSFS